MKPILLLFVLLFSTASSASSLPEIDYDRVLAASSAEDGEDGADVEIAVEESEDDNDVELAMEEDDKNLVTPDLIEEERSNTKAKQPKAVIKCKGNCNSIKRNKIRRCNRKKWGTKNPRQKKQVCKMAALVAHYNCFDECDVQNKRIRKRCGRKCYNLKSGCIKRCEKRNKKALTKLRWYVWCCVHVALASA